MNSEKLFSKPLLILFSLIFSLTAFPRTTESDIISGVLQVKFTKKSLKEVKTIIHISDFIDPVITKMMVNIQFTEGRKIFPDFDSNNLTIYSKNGETVQLRDLSTWYVVKFSEQADIENLIKQLMKIESVIGVAPLSQVHPNTDPPDDPDYENHDQWGLTNYYQNGADIHALEAWNYSMGSSDIKVAVIDGGVDYEHIDLDPGDRSRVIAGSDTGDDDNDPMDDCPAGNGLFGGHGTKVAGVIGAITNNDYMCAGIMWNTQIMPVKVATTDAP